MLTLKITIIAIMVILTGGAWFPPSLRKYRSIIVLIGIVSTVSTVYLFRDVINDIKEEIQGEVQSSVKSLGAPPLVNFVTAIEALTIPRDAGWNIRGWDSLMSYMPWLRLAQNSETGGEHHIFQSCSHFDRRGKARFIFAGLSPINFAGDKVIEWSVAACGANAGLSSITFTSDHTRDLSGIAKGIKDDFLSKKYQISYLGCEGFFAEPTSYYKISKQGILPFYLKINQWQASTSSMIHVTINFDSEAVKTINPCTRNLDIMGIKYPRL